MQILVLLIVRIYIVLVTDVLASHILYGALVYKG